MPRTLQARDLLFDPSSAWEHAPLADCFSGMRQFAQAAAQAPVNTTVAATLWCV